MIFFLFGCFTLHQVSKLSDYSSDIEMEKNARKAIQLATKETTLNKTAHQAIAMQVVGRLRVANSTTIDGSLAILKKSDKHSALQYQTIWALGELGRELDWNEDSQKIHHQLLIHLKNSKNPTEAHYLLEAIGKIYCHHSHTLAEDIKTTKVLQSYEANNQEVPGVLLILLEKIQSLPVLISLLNEQMESQGTLPETYGAILELMRFIHENQSQLINNHAHYQQQIEDAFSSSTALLSLESKAVTLMIVWMFSEVATDPVLATYIVDSLLELQPTADLATQQIVSYTLSKMISEEKARVYFRQTYFYQVQSDSELEMLYQIQQHELDLIQQIFGVSLEKENAP